jgi:hypothetical protein
VSRGCRFFGDRVGIDLQDGPTASVGTSILLPRSIFITSYDYVQASSPLAEDAHEIFAGFSTPLSSRFNLTAYGNRRVERREPGF